MLEVSDVSAETTISSHVQFSVAFVLLPVGERLAKVLVLCGVSNTDTVVC